MKFINTYSIAEIISVILLVIAVIGLFLTYKQLQNTHKTQKAIFFRELYSTLFSDRDLRDAFYQIEYSNFKYTSKFHGSQKERLIDKLLSFANMVCDLYFEGNISKHEMNFFKYEFLRIYKNDNIKSYKSFQK